MPTFMTDDIAKALYSSPTPQTVIDGVVINPQPPITYGPEYNNIQSVTIFEVRRDWLIEQGMVAGDTVLVVGAGYGGLIKVLVAEGMDVYGLEPGSWIWENLNEFEPDPVLRGKLGNDWIGSGTEQATLVGLGSNAAATFKWVVDEDAAPAHTDAELPVFISGLDARWQGNLTRRALTPRAITRIVHIVSAMTVESGPGDSSQNWKTLADWKAVAPSHTWVDQRGNVG